MSLPRPPRGRPKGSGINDRPRLREIAALMISNPQIRPTTAIKMLGESDPSVVRRLRDKFYAMQSELMSEVRGGVMDTERPATHQGHPPVGVQRLEASSARVLSLITNEQVRRADPPAAAISPPVVAGETFAQRVAGLERPATDGVVTRERLAELAAYNVMVALAIQSQINAMPSAGNHRDGNTQLTAIATLLRQSIDVGEQAMTAGWPRPERKPFNA